jgi:hypothetical protein
VFQISQESFNSLKLELKVIDRKLKTETVKGRILRASLSVTTVLILANRFQFLNQWYWILIALAASAFLWDVFSSALANVSVAISESLKEKAKK